MTTLNASETGCAGLIQRHLRKPKKSNVDRDKIDFLSGAIIFALCAPAKIYQSRLNPWMSPLMQPVLGDVTGPLAWCAPLEQMMKRYGLFAACGIPIN